ncbi:restriction endonuclease subunit S [Butyrivibrio sp. XPD2002]|uniref:restriction endonuclease subunit S n=1 Tax=Butyrivibrio sp. XPD2002 TaxID=1280665 RepID=UPI00041C2B7C|nr:restriction endonuclease subunit S [Butyrivibrio sp. XPD2002]
MSERKKPKLRFPGFTDDWEQRKLGEVSSFITKGATPTTYGYEWQDEGIPFFRNDCIKDNIFVYGDYSYISDEANAALSRSEIKGDDILVAITGDIGKAGIVPKNIEKANINQHIARVRIEKDVIPYFVYQSLITEGQQRKYKQIKTGLSMPQLSLEQIRDTVILAPSINEQTKISDFMENLDNLITLHQRKCDEILRYKKAMLQKMFPKDGAKIPEIRFPGFTGDWEQRKLEAVVDSVDTGKSKFDKEGSSGEYPILGSTSVIGYDEEYDYEGDFILTARVGANAGSLYRHAGKVKISDNTVFIQASQNIEFLYHLLTQFDIKKLSFGTGQPLVKASELKNLELMMPRDINEQMKIGDYFKQLDNLITLHQRKVAQLKELKKGLLQQMFV